MATCPVRNSQPSFRARPSASRNDRSFGLVIVPAVDVAHLLAGCGVEQARERVHPRHLLLLCRGAAAVAHALGLRRRLFEHAVGRDILRARTRAGDVASCQCSCPGASRHSNSRWRRATRRGSRCRRQPCTRRRDTSPRRSCWCWDRAGPRPNRCSRGHARCRDGSA